MARSHCNSECSMRMSRQRFPFEELRMRRDRVVRLQPRLCVFWSLEAGLGWVGLPAAPLTWASVGSRACLCLRFGPGQQPLAALGSGSPLGTVSVDQHSCTPDKPTTARRRLTSYFILILPNGDEVRLVAHEHTRQQNRRIQQIDHVKR